MQWQKTLFLKPESTSRYKSESFWIHVFENNCFYNDEFTNVQNNLIFYNEYGGQWYKDMVQWKHCFFEAQKLWQGQQKQNTHYTESCKGCQKPFSHYRQVAHDNKIEKGGSEMLSQNDVEFCSE